MLTLPRPAQVCASLRHPIVGASLLAGLLLSPLGATAQPSSTLPLTAGGVPVALPAPPPSSGSASSDHCVVINSGVVGYGSLTLALDGPGAQATCAATMDKEQAAGNPDVGSNYFFVDPRLPTPAMSSWSCSFQQNGLQLAVVAAGGPQQAPLLGKWVCQAIDGSGDWGGVQWGPAAAN